MPSEQAIADYLAGVLPPEKLEALEEEVLASPELLKEFVEQQRVDAALGVLFDPEPERVEAAILASVHSVTDDAMERRVLAHTVRARAPRQQILRRTPQPLVIARPSWLPTFLFALATILILAGGVWWNLYRGKGAQPPVVAQLKTDAGARWQRSLQQGAQIRTGPLVLHAGLAELEFRNGAVLAVEGPAKIELASADRMILRSGKVAAEVPPRAKGFTVETSAGNVTDLGTRFGVHVAGNGVTEAHVFEGRVNVASSAELGGQQRELRTAMALSMDPKNGTVTNIKSDPEMFPQPGREIAGLLIGGDFEPGTDISSLGIPKTPQVWSGDLCEILPEFKGIRPHAGRGMLRILQPGPWTTGTPPKSRLAEKWQLVDLRPFKELFAKGDAVIEGSAQFNREPAEPDTGRIFVMQVLALRGDPTEMKTMWLRRYELALARGEGKVNTDDDPTTWQPGSVKMALPPETDFLLMSVQAIGAWAATGERQIGRFVDSASLRLRIPPHGSAMARR
jgi:ferric-dicitrate binding protein FerR (iron transport regulator)